MENRAVGYEDYYIDNIDEVNERVSGEYEQFLGMTSGDLISTFDEEGELDLEKTSKIRSAIIEELDKTIIGQDEAKKALAITLATGLKSRKEGPLGVFFFVGPSGVGKTQIAKELGKLLFGDDVPYPSREIACELLTRSHTLSNLIGSSKNYVGYGEPPFLADTKVFQGYNARKVPTAEQKEKMTENMRLIREIPSRLNNLSILVLNEIEKAHMDINQALLTAIDEGKVSMPTGKESNKKCPFSEVTNLSNTIIIMTSNVGNKTKKKSNPIGFVSRKEADSYYYLDAYDNNFSPEFKGRIKKAGEVISFHRVTKTDCKEIVYKELKRTNRNLLESFTYRNAEVSAVILDDVVDFLVNEGHSEDFGARELLGVYRKHIEDNLALVDENGELDRVIEDGYKYTVFFYMKDEKIKIHIKKTGEVEVPEAYRNTVAIEKELNREELAKSMALVPVLDDVEIPDTWELFDFDKEDVKENLGILEKQLIDLMESDGNSKELKAEILKVKDKLVELKEKLDSNESMDDVKELIAKLRKDLEGISNKKPVISPQSYYVTSPRIIEGGLFNVGNFLPSAMTNRLGLMANLEAFGGDVEAFADKIFGLQIRYIQLYGLRDEYDIDFNDELKEIELELTRMGLQEHKIEALKVKAHLSMAGEFSEYLDYKGLELLDDDEKATFSRQDLKYIEKISKNFMKKLKKKGCSIDSKEVCEEKLYIEGIVENIIGKQLSKKQLKALVKIMDRAYKHA